MGYFERFVSRRYLLNHSNRALVSIITFIAIAGLTLGVAALIIVIGVIEGIDQDIFGKIIEIQPHLKISRADESDFTDWKGVLEKTRGISGVSVAEPIISRQVLLETGTRRDAPRVPAQLIGVEALGNSHIYAIPNTRTGGDIIIGPKEILPGIHLAYQLDAKLEENILVTTGQMQKTANGWRPRMRNLKVIGAFRTGIGEFEAVTAFISLEAAREVFGLPEAVDFVQLKLDDPFNVSVFKKSLAATLGPEFKLATWEEENGEFFQALKLEKMGLTTILLLVVIVASFNIVGTLILMVMEKKRQIGVLKAMGASESMIRNTFLSAGSVIGVIGTICGLALGLLGCYILKYQLKFEMPTAVANFDHLPVQFNWLTIALIVVASLAISLLAALFPAAQAARLDPIEALRHD